MSIQLGKIYALHFFGTDVWERSAGKPIEFFRTELCEEQGAFGNGDCQTFDWLRITHLGQFNNDLYDVEVTVTFPHDCQTCPTPGLGNRVWGSAGIALAASGQTVKAHIPHISRGFTEEIRIPRCAIDRDCNSNENGLGLTIRVAVPPPNSTNAATTLLRQLGAGRCHIEQCSWPDPTVTGLPSVV